MTYLRDGKLILLDDPSIPTNFRFGAALGLPDSVATVDMSQLHTIEMAPDPAVADVTISDMRAVYSAVVAGHMETSVTVSGPARQVHELLRRLEAVGMITIVADLEQTVKGE